MSIICRPETNCSRESYNFFLLLPPSQTSPGIETNSIVKKHRPTGKSLILEENASELYKLSTLQKFLGPVPSQWLDSAARLWLVYILFDSSLYWSLSMSDCSHKMEVFHQRCLRIHIPPSPKGYSVASGWQRGYRSSGLSSAN